MTTNYFIAGNNNEGIKVEFDKRKRTITAFGWFDTMAGIKGFTMPFAEFLDKLDITEQDIVRSRADVMRAEQCTLEE